MMLHPKPSPFHGSMRAARKLRYKPAPSLVSSDENLLTVAGDATAGFTVAPGPLTGVDADANGVIGTATVTATADADLGDGVTNVAAVGSVVIVAGDAVLGNLSIGGQPA